MGGMKRAAVAVLLAGCGASSGPSCFECGLTDEWARADTERARDSAERWRAEIRETYSGADVVAMRRLIDQIGSGEASVEAGHRAVEPLPRIYDADLLRALVAVSAEDAASGEAHAARAALLGACARRVMFRPGAEEVLVACAQDAATSELCERAREALMAREPDVASTEGRAGP